MLANKLMGGAGEDTLYVDDVFSTYLYTGNGSTQTITNGIDLAGQGGMVWSKSRASGQSHFLIDSAAGLSWGLSNGTNAFSPPSAAPPGVISSFNSNGYTLGVNSGVNLSGEANVSWTFRKAPKFFDVVTYTGNGVAGRQIAHSLGQEVGMVIVKNTTTMSNWAVYHKSLGNNSGLLLNSDSPAGVNFGVWATTSPTVSNFTVGSHPNVNSSSGDSYVAYLFAHDPSADGIIQCGSFTAGATVNLGFEPQYLLVKCSSSAEEWRVFDTMRRLKSDAGGQALLVPNSSAAETTFNYPTINAQGFSFGGITSATYIYLAIRRPNKPPTTGTEVFMPVVFGSSGVNTSGFPVDLVIDVSRNDPNGNDVWDRLRGSGKFVRTYAPASETLYSNVPYFDSNTSANFNSGWGTNQIALNFRRAPGFFDIVCYTGTSVARTVPHSLGVAPELMIVKQRDGSGSNWYVYHKQSGISNSGALSLDTTYYAGQYPYSTNPWNNTLPTSSVFSLSNGSDFNSGSPIRNYVWYGFASLPGISKVGSYTGNGTSQTINCGFTTGARFVLVKSSSTTGSWWLFDSVRGIVAGTDFGLQLNSTAAEVTSADAIDPNVVGFDVVQEATCSLNTNGVTYIYLAIS